MNLFKRRQNKQEAKLQSLVDEILNSSVIRKKGLGAVIETSAEENFFFRELVKYFLQENLQPRAIYLEPMSNQSFSVQYAGYPIGRIKIRGKSTYMQILKGLYGVKELSDCPLTEYINHIPEWIKRAKYCLRD